MNAPASRTHEHCREWVRQGHDVTVITGVPNHPRGVLFEGYANRLVQEENVDGIRVIRSWMLLSPNEGFLGRIANYLLFAIAACLLNFKSERPDVVVATSPQFFCGLAGMLVSRLRRAPFILEVRDLWPESIVQLEQLHPGPLLRTLERLETMLYRSAAGIVVNTSAFIQHIAARGVAPEKIELVYNGIDPSLFRPQPPDDALLRKHGLKDKYLVAYIGTLGLAHGVETLLDAAERLQDQQDLHFLIIGDGAARESLAAQAAQRGLANVTLLGLRPRSEIPGWIASIDLLVVLLRNLQVFTSVIPSKIFEFCAQERPVIVSTPMGEIRTLIEAADAARSVEPEQPEALAEAILACRSDPQAAAAMASRGRQWVATEFVRDDLARRMLCFMLQVVADERDRP
ncbi:MAG: glycosyltransferase family 4 protein [Myxococcota bacterium]|nr:glycosyltransferase family 4 protein [Myxococcota bacterium]